jgi:hypothetical protein
MGAGYESNLTWRTPDIEDRVSYNGVLHLTMATGDTDFPDQALGA